MKTITGLIIVLIAASCVTQKKCFEKYPPVVSVEIKDTVIYRDTTIYITLPPDTVTNTDTVELYITPEKEVFSIDTLKTENDFSVALAWVYRSRLHQMLWNKQNPLAVVLDSVIRERDYYKKIVETHQEPPEKPKYIGWLTQVIIVLGILLLIIVVVKIFK